jgi:heme O synthase-like polyprenyltransferase
LLEAIRTWRERDGNLYARKLFRFSLVYLALMCAVMVIDRIILS